MPIKNVSANQSTFCEDELSGSTTSTTTPKYMTGGTATSTLPTTNCSGDGSAVIDGAVLDIQITSTSTPPTLNIRIEGSMNNKDWYPEVYPVFTVVPGGMATTTLGTTPYHSYQFLVSTTTDNGGSGDSQRVHLSFPIALNHRYNRIIFSLATSSAPATLYADLVGRKQQLAR